MVTVLFIVYQFTFVAELGETNSKAQERGRHGPNEGSNRKHPRDLNFREAGRLMAKNTGREKEDDGKENQAGEEAKKIQGHMEKEEKGEKAAQGVNEAPVLQQNVIENPKESKPIQNLLTFKCKTSGKQISVDRINDNYCDCPEDGSDEPRTNACANGRFTCLKHVKAFPELIPSGWVNDGVCDCCDGSDEWKMRKSVPDLAVSLQKKIGRYLSPCPNQCPDAV